MENFFETYGNFFQGLWNKIFVLMKLILGSYAARQGQGNFPLRD